MTTHSTIAFYLYILIIAGTLIFHVPGCSSSALDTSKQEWSDLIQGIERERDSTQAWIDEGGDMRGRGRFRVWVCNSALDHLRKTGPSALQQPFVMGASIAQGTDGIHGINVHWLGKGVDVVGFFVVLEDGTTHDIFVRSQDIDIIKQTVPKPSKYLVICIYDEKTTDAENLAGDFEDSISIIWNSGLFDKVFNDNEVEGIGLILNNESRSMPGQVMYIDNVQRRITDKDPEP